MRHGNSNMGRDLRTGTIKGAIASKSYNPLKIHLTEFADLETIGATEQPPPAKGGFSHRQ